MSRYERLSLQKARADNFDFITTQMVAAILGISTTWVIVGVEDATVNPLLPRRQVFLRQTTPHITSYAGSEPGTIGGHRINEWSIVISVEDYDTGPDIR
jgi:hypothetical protein